MSKQKNEGEKILMDYCKEIIKRIDKMSGKYSVYELFSDWIEMYALSIANLIDTGSETWKYREDLYLRIQQKYSKDEMKNFILLRDLLVDALENCREDALGYVFSELQLNSSSLAQEFTMPHTANLMTELVLDFEKVVNDKRLDFYEPACGSGVLIISAADYLYKHGLNYQKIFHVVAQDIDLRCIYMTYIQCSLLGIQAEIVHGDSIEKPYPSEKYPEYAIFKTPFYYLGPTIFSDKNIFLKNN